MYAFLYYFTNSFFLSSYFIFTLSKLSVLDLLSKSFIFIFFFLSLLLFYLHFNPIIFSLCFQPGWFSFVLLLVEASQLRLFFPAYFSPCGLLTHVVFLLLTTSFLNSYISALKYILVILSLALLRFLDLMVIYLTTIFICSMKSILLS